ncbi:Spherulin-1A [Fusarium oxysporum f. sp. rapae]|uniref:Spherulin-1A n=1 Tax=Fusarium oxysporum f. sp. rapae TaxID=485398 RepID=A0A8J5TPF2_FUSOX|nr:Spherulin-1A [Fusarium oxysporum f. sp. rapae]
MGIIMKRRSFLMKHHSYAACLCQVMGTDAAHYDQDLLDQASISAAGLVFNPDCKDAVFVAAFDNADPGVNQITQIFFALNGDVVQATPDGVQTIDGKDIESFRSHILANIALGIGACLNKCGGMKRNTRRDISDLLS